MKRNYLAIVLAAFVIAGCTQRPMLNSNLPKYYAYNPEDTIGNYPFLQMLRIDSARAEYLLERPYGLPPSDMMKEIGLGSDSMGYKVGDEKIFDTVEAKWYELMRLCSQKQYEELLSMYIKEETEIGIALANSTNKFDLDYFVIGPLLFEQLDEEEAAEIMVKFLEYDKFLTESVILFGESQLGYVPPQYAFQLEILNKVYLKLDEWEKAEALIEPYRKAVYLLSDDTLMNEYDITGVKLNIYADMDDGVRLKEALVEYRAFLVQYAKDSHQDLDEQIENMDKLIKSVEEQ